MSNLRIINNKIDFFGNETEIFSRHLGFLTKYVRTTTCDSTTCPKNSRNLTHQQLPQLVNHETQVEKVVNNWFNECGSSPCGQLFLEEPKHTNNFYTSNKIVIDDDG